MSAYFPARDKARIPCQKKTSVLTVCGRLFVNQICFICFYVKLISTQCDKWFYSAEVFRISEAALLLSELANIIVKLRRYSFHQFVPQNEISTFRSWNMFVLLVVRCDRQYSIVIECNGSRFVHNHETFTLSRVCFVSSGNLIKFTRGIF